jgi:quercetin dioxygenase-like cupin family protein
MSGRGYALGPGGSVTDDAGVKANGPATGGAFTIIESRTTGGAPPHVHHNEDEAMYVVDGAIWARCGDDRFDLGPGSFVFLPRGVPHEWDVVGDGATVLIFASPAGLDAFLREFHDPLLDRADVARRYGVEFL